MEVHNIIGLYQCDELEITVLGKYDRYERFYGTVLESNNKDHPVGRVLDNWSWDFSRMPDDFSLTVKQDNSKYNQKLIPPKTSTVIEDHERWKPQLGDKVEILAGDLIGKTRYPRAIDATKDPVQYLVYTNAEGHHRSGSTWVAKADMKLICANPHGPTENWYPLENLN